MARTRASRGRGGQASSPRDSSAPYSRHTSPSTVGRSIQNRRGGANIRQPFILNSSSSSSRPKHNGPRIAPNLSENNPFASTTSGSRYFSATTGPSTRTQQLQGQKVTSATQAQPNSTTQGQTTSTTHGFSKEAMAGSYEEQGGNSSVLAPLITDSSDDTDNEVVMAIDVRDRCTLGCAYYVAREEKLYFMQDCKLSDKTMVETCKFLRTI
jgi:hypothetical protein